MPLARKACVKHRGIEPDGGRMIHERIRLGILVASPNFRHSVPFARELISLDDVSGGRFTLGIGAGGTGWDASVLGQMPWPLRERADRFVEFVTLLDLLLREPVVSHRGAFYSADEARSHPGCVQRPRIPFAVAATPIDGARLAWRRPGPSDPEEPGDVSLDKGAVLGTRLHVLLPRTGLYEIVVKAVGTGPTGPVSTESMVRIAFGTAVTAPLERDGVAEFTVKENRP